MRMATQQLPVEVATFLLKDKNFQNMDEFTKASMSSCQIVLKFEYYVIRDIIPISYLYKISEFKLEIIWNKHPYLEG